MLSHYAKSCISSTWEEELEFIPFAILAKKENLFGKQTVFPSNEKKTFCLNDSVKFFFFKKIMNCVSLFNAGLTQAEFTKCPVQSACVTRDTLRQ